MDTSPYNLPNMLTTWGFLADLFFSDQEAHARGLLETDEFATR